MLERARRLWRSRPETTAAVLLWLLAFGVVAVIVAATPDYEPLADSADYARHAVSIAHGEGYPPATSTTVGEGPTAFRPPAYPALLGAVYALSGDSLTAGRLATGGVGALSVVLLFLLVRDLWGLRAGLVAGLLGAVLPPLVVVRTGLFTEPLFLLFVLAALLLALRYRARPERLWLAAAVGALCGLAALTRSNGVLMVALVPLLMVTASGPRPRRLAGALTIMVAAVLVIAPWSIRNAVVFEKWVPITTQSGITYIQVLNDRSRASDGDVRNDAPELWRVVRDPRLDESEVDAELRRRAFDYAKEHPGYVVKAFPLNVLRMFQLTPGTFSGWFSYGGNGLLWPGWARTLTQGTVYVVYALAMLGAVVLLRRPSLRPPLLLWLVPLALVLAGGLAAGAARYRAPLDPFLVALAALAIASLTRRRPRTP